MKYSFDFKNVISPMMQTDGGSGVWTQTEFSEIPQNFS